MGSKVAILVESMAELEIVPRPEVTAAISDDPHDLSDVSSEDEEEEEEFTGIELVRAVPVPDLVPAVQVPVFRLPVLVLICDIRHQWNSIWYSSYFAYRYWYSSATSVESVEFDLVLKSTHLPVQLYSCTHLRQRPKPVQHPILQSWVLVVPVGTGIVAS